LYAQKGWDIDLVSKDYTNITTEHFYVKEEIFAGLVADWVKNSQET
jgi:hypothetical protein